MNDDDISNILIKLQKIKMSDADKSSLCQSILKKINYTPGEGVRSNYLSYFAIINQRRIIVGALVVLLLSTTGIALAAEKSVPGDWFYPIKIGINEPVKYKFTTEAEAKNWPLILAEKRLEETKQMIEEGRFDAQQEEYVTTYIKDRFVDYRRAEKSIATTGDKTNLPSLPPEFTDKLNSYKKIIQQNNKNPETLIKEIDTELEKINPPVPIPLIKNRPQNTPALQIGVPVRDPVIDIFSTTTETNNLSTSTNDSTKKSGPETKNEEGTADSQTEDHLPLDPIDILPNLGL